MNKRHYEHTLPNIRGSLSNTYLLGAEEVFRSLQEQKTEDEADRILRRISR